MVHKSGNGCYKLLSRVIFSNNKFLIPCLLYSLSVEASASIPGTVASNLLSFLSFSLSFSSRLSLPAFSTRNLLQQVYQAFAIQILSLMIIFSAFNISAVVVAYINTMKTTFDFDFDLYQAVNQHGYT